MLPDINGISFCLKITSADYKIPIMLLTAKDLCRDKVFASDSDADDYVHKPFNFDELMATIRALLRRDTDISFSILQ